MNNLRGKSLQRKQQGGGNEAEEASSRPWTWDPRIVRVSRTYGGKDRHSKVRTIKGLRDRRVRLSAPTAIFLYDLQEKLGLNRPSKVVDWLLNAARQEIDRLPPLQVPFGGFSQSSQPNMTVPRDNDRAVEGNHLGIWNLDQDTHEMRDKDGVLGRVQLGNIHDDESSRPTFAVNDLDPKTRPQPSSAGGGGDLSMFQSYNGAPPASVGYDVNLLDYSRSNSFISNSLFASFHETIVSTSNASRQSDYDGHKLSPFSRPADH